MDRLTVTCFGRIELPEDEWIYGTYWTGYSVDLVSCVSLSDAVSLTERRLMEPYLNLVHVREARGFSPERVLIRDFPRRLVLGGRVSFGGIEWCTPVSSDDEARQVQTAATELRVESGIESGWDNFCTARSLEGRAQLLEARLVDPIWRADATDLLRNRRCAPTAIPQPRDDRELSIDNR